MWQVGHRAEKDFLPLLLYSKQECSLEAESSNSSSGWRLEACVSHMWHWCCSSITAGWSSTSFLGTRDLSLFNAFPLAFVHAFRVRGEPGYPFGPIWALAFLFSRHTFLGWRDGSVVKINLILAARQRINSLRSMTCKRACCVSINCDCRELTS